MNIINGPWIRTCTAAHGVFIVSDTDRQLICTVKGGERANLVASAPDLLEALAWFIDDIDGTHTVMVDFDANVERARAAISSARGAG